MTVIGKPPRRGPTFADVAIGQPFVLLRAPSRIQMVRIDDHEGHGPRPFNAVALPGAGRTHIGDGEPVELLTLTPTEPKPAPALTTYREVPSGKWFEFTGPEMDPGPRLMCNKPSRGHIALPYSDFVRSSGQYDAEPVRILTPIDVADYILRAEAASVVVHAEQGTAVERAGSDTFFIGALAPSVSTKRLREIVRQGAAELAKLDAERDGTS